jgi:hypothetical protein
VTAATTTRAGTDLLPRATFTRVRDTIARDHPDAAHLADRILDQALAFLNAAATFPGLGLRPSPLVDLGWHALILDTRLYAALCLELGAFVHHIPDDPTAATGHDRAADLADTTRVIGALGYTVDPAVWSAAARCTSCHEEGGCSSGGRDGNENSDTRKPPPSPQRP